jgi:hypothetical protein
MGVIGDSIQRIGPADRSSKQHPRSVRSIPAGYLLEPADSGTLAPPARQN